MFNNYKLALAQVFSISVRKAFSQSISQAYILSVEKSKEFSNCAQHAVPYLRFFYSQALLERDAKRMGLGYFTAFNKAKNCKHTVITLNNWSLTAHHLSTNAKVPKKAKYRACYASKNYDLFDDTLDNMDTIPREGYVWLLHDGKGINVDSLCFTIPAPDQQSIIYSEPLDIISPRKTEPEKIDDNLENLIKARTESLMMLENF